MMKLRFLTAGESHGPSEIAILEGLPAGVPITHSDIQKDLMKRKGGAGRGGRGKIESDEVSILSGVRFGLTLGSPIALEIKNQDFKNWKDKMSIEWNPIAADPSIKVHNPRPGHADLAGAIKYQFRDIRNVLERASARETVMRVALGAVTRAFLTQFGIKIGSHTVQIGSIVSTYDPQSFDELRDLFSIDPDIRCLDEKTRMKMKKEILQAIKTKNTLGGVVEIRAYHVPAGLGSYVHFDRKLDGRIAQALMSIPSVKAVEIGNGIKSAAKRGSKVQDEIQYKNNTFIRASNNAGGLEGGVTNGQEIICRVYHKPISTIPSPLKTIDIETKQDTLALVERSDICVVPRAGVVSEAMLALTLADAFLEKFGGDSLAEVKKNYEGFMMQISTM